MAAMQCYQQGRPRVLAALHVKRITTIAASQSVLVMVWWRRGMCFQRRGTQGPPSSG